MIRILESYKQRILKCGQCLFEGDFVFLQVRIGLLFVPFETYIVLIEGLR